MSVANRIRSLDDVEKIQQKNESRFKELSDTIDELAGQTSRGFSQTSKRLDSGLADVRQTLREVAASQKEGEKQLAAWQAQIAKTDAQIAKTDAQIAETAALQKELSAEADKRQKENEKGFKELRKQLGYYGNTRGEFVENLALPSIQRIVKKDLKGNYWGPLYYKYKGEVLQVDAWGTSVGNDAAYLFEVKHKFRSKAIKQVFRQIKKFRILYPEYACTPIYPFIVAGVIDEEGEKKVWQAGVQLLKFGDGTFRLCRPPEKFEPAYGHGITRHGRMVPPPLPEYLRKLMSSHDTNVSLH